LEQNLLSGLFDSLQLERRLGLNKPFFLSAATTFAGDKPSIMINTAQKSYRH
jgi:hypothetical protein